MTNKTKTYINPKESKVFSEIFLNIFGDKSASVCFDINFAGIPKQFQIDDAKRVAKKFHYNISRKYYGQDARKRKKLANLAAFLHMEPDPHIHIIVELPENNDLQIVKDFCDDFVLKNYHICIPQRKKEQMSYCEMTKTIEGSSFYNLRFGTDTCLIF